MVKRAALALVVAGIVVACYGFFVGNGAMPAAVSISSQEPMVTIGDVDVVVSVARTKSERQLGLSGTESLAPLTGKLFIFERSERYGFWMKEMNYSIDMIWLDEEKRIVHIEEAVTPESYPYIYKPDAPAQYVLEVQAHFVTNYAIRVGDRVTFSNLE